MNYGNFCRRNESICVDGSIDITSRLDREIIDLSELCHFSVDIKTIINRTFSIRVEGDYFEGTRRLNISRICNASYDKGDRCTSLNLLCTLDDNYVVHYILFADKIWVCAHPITSNLCWPQDQSIRNIDVYVAALRDRAARDEYECVS